MGQAGRVVGKGREMQRVAGGEIRKEVSGVSIMYLLYSVNLVGSMCVCIQNNLVCSFGVIH